MRTPIAMMAAALIGLSAPCAANEVPDQVAGTPTVTDGDTLRFGNVRVRFHGIDAPETRQKCRDTQGAVYHFGIGSTDALAALVHGREIVCRRRPPTATGG